MIFPSADGIYTVLSWNKKQYRVVLCGIMPVGGSPGFISPYDFIYKILFPEDFIHDELHRMNGMPVQMDKNASGRFQRLFHQHQPDSDHLQIRTPVVFPDIAVSGMPSDHLRIAYRRFNFYSHSLLCLRIKRRIDIDEIYGLHQRTVRDFLREKPRVVAQKKRPEQSSDSSETGKTANLPPAHQKKKQSLFRRPPPQKKILPSFFSSQFLPLHTAAVCHTPPPLFSRFVEVHGVYSSFSALSSPAPADWFPVSARLGDSAVFSCRLSC